MELSALLVPTERPPTDIEVKRALLLFDQVFLIPPDDRDIFPPAFYMQAMFPEIPIPVYLNQGPVLPLGKNAGYDDAFERLLDDSREAQAQGLLVLKPPAPDPQGLHIGGAPYPEDRGPPMPILHFTRVFTSSEPLMRSMMQGLPRLQALTKSNPVEVAPSGHEHGWNKLFALGEGDVGGLVTRLTASRIGSLVKCLDIATKASIHLFSADRGVAATLGAVERLAEGSLESVLGDDEQRSVRMAQRAENVLAQLFVPDAVLGQMTYRQVLACRTRSWGDAGERRELFFRVVRSLSNECRSDDEFDRRVKVEVEGYLKACRDFNDEVKGKSISLAAVTSLGALTAGAAANQLLGIDSFATAVVGAGAAVLGTVAKEAPHLLKMWTARGRTRAGAGRALYGPYESLKLR
ncbi:MAG: hypothetical protein H6718_37055 [Polyangiaceae bacterium]|nr:hypothetical protein [Polyangiaceae bacterium]